MAPLNQTNSFTPVAMQVQRSTGSSYLTSGYPEFPANNTLAFSPTVDWADSQENNSFAYIIEWDATEVLSNFTFSLTDDAGGRFAIDADTGQVTVADGSQIDFDAAASHNISIEVTDAAGNSHVDTLAITVDNEQDANQVVPGPLTIDEDSTLTFSAGQPPPKSASVIQ